MKSAGIRGWKANQAIYDEHGLIGIGDFVFEEAKLVAEIDGQAWHVTPDRFQSDRTKQNRLNDAGWKVRRFTWKDLTETPKETLHRVRMSLESTGW